MTRDNERLANNTLNGLAIGTGLFFGGLFLTVWSWGLASPIGIPLMLAGIAFPFVEAFMARHGQGWTGYDSDGSVVMGRGEAGRLHRDTLARHKSSPQHRRAPTP